MSEEEGHSSSSFDEETRSAPPPPEPDSPQESSLPPPPSSSNNNPHERPSFSNALQSPRVPSRYLGVRGWSGRTNDLLYAPPQLRRKNEEEEEGPTHDTSNVSGSGNVSGSVIVSESGSGNVVNGRSERRSGGRSKSKEEVLVYFGGDIQDFPEAMDLHMSNRLYLRWSLESTATLLGTQFPFHHIVVIRPSRMHLHTFSCFDNFLPSSGETSAPENIPYNGALLHLQLLLSQLSSLVQKDKKRGEGGDELNNGQEADSSCESEESGKEIKFHEADLTLVGFSKGCVVLNQFAYELHFIKTLTPDDRSLDSFLKCISHIYWLDAGHGGSKNFWITSRAILETLVRLHPTIHVHLTPYQTHDAARPLIGREERIFSDSVKKLGGTIVRYAHFPHLPPSLQNHFQLLSEFRSGETGGVQEYYGSLEAECSEGSYDSTGLQGTMLTLD